MMLSIIYCVILYGKLTVKSNMVRDTYLTIADESYCIKEIQNSIPCLDKVDTDARATLFNYVSYYDFLVKDARSR